MQILPVHLSLPTPRVCYPLLAALLLVVPAGRLTGAEDGLPREAERALSKHREAVGGEKRIAALTSLRAHGVYQDETVPRLPFVFTLVPPKYSRFQYGPDEGRVVVAVGPDGGWSRGVDGTQVNLAMTAAHVARHARSVDYTAMALLRRDPDELEYLGREKRNGRRVFVFRAPLPYSETAVYFLDARKSVLSEVHETWWLAGHTVEIERRYDDFREVEGVLLPHFYAETNPSGTRTFTFEKIEINPEVDPALFALPDDVVDEPTG